MLATPIFSAPLLSSLVTSWLLGAAAAAPLPTYDVLFLAGDATAHAEVQNQSQAEKDREKERERLQKERERAQEERDRARERAQEERDRARERAQQERERAQDRAEQERERRQRQAEHNREHNRGGEFQEVNGEKIVKSFTVGRDGSLLLHNVSGDIVVTAGGANDIRVEAIKHAKGRTQSEARAQLENVQLSIQNAGGRVEVLTEHRGRESRAWVSFNVMVPYDARVELHSVSGDITVTGVKGELRAESVSGDVKASALSRLVLMKTLSGDVEINGAESDGTISLSSVSGDVNANNLKARGVEVSSVSGDSVLNGCTCDRAQVNTISGSVQYSGRLVKTGRYEFKSHSGDITLQYLGSAFDLTANTFSGALTFQPALPASVKNTSSRYGPGKSMRGAVNGGGAYVELTTFSGDIIVTKGGQ